MSFRHLVVRLAIVLMALLAAGWAVAQETQANPPAGEAAAEPAPAEAPANETAPPAAPAPAAPAAHGTVVYGDAKAGEAKAAVCGACHGADGNSALAMYPKLAGQNEAYIARQLELFKSQQRQNAIMLGFAMPLSTQDMHDLGAFYASKTAMAGVADETLAKRGEALWRGGDAKAGVPACMACHGPDGRGMAGAAYPQLAGQWTDYVAAKLTEWQEGATWGSDTNAKIMPAIAHALGKDDIAAVASYVEGLHTAGAGTASASK
ncbi:c-type cytochrome [Dokdonella sp.]|uniref:c-type cytochrome n=1 Tax=Dokdonella sp. TaxID=2291710 RepID=UPI0031BEC826|nr:cytochrome c4 [Dokdonella sp.]